MLGLGALLVAGAVLIFVFLFRTGKKFERADFERRNSAGVQEFASYEDMARARRNRGLFGVAAPLLGTASVVMLFVGGLMVFIELQ